MLLNRNIPPAYQTIDQVKLIDPKVITLDNGIPAHFIEAGTQEILKIDIIFEAGSWYQPKPPIASATSEMLMEGTGEFSSQQIAEKLDYYGAFIHPQPTKDFASLSLFTLKKYLPETIKILEDIVKNPSFPQHELTNFSNKKQQLFIIEMEKVTNIARRAFNEQLFGSLHPYGRNVQLKDYQSLTRNDLLDFHQNYYTPEKAKIIVTGKTDDAVIQWINQHFGTPDWEKNKKDVPQKKLSGHKIIREKIIKKANARQSAIRVGIRMPTQTHPDFLKLNILNTILGGYFGSRLMKNIREEKGYTYGIGSVLISLKKEGFLVIVSEVGSAYTKKTLHEIFKEIRRLREEKVSPEELTLVKNYMMGDFLRSFDGPFAISESYRSMLDFHLSMDYFSRVIKTIKSITADEIMDLANLYLIEENFVRTIAGKYE
ncbi:MAG: pitrilysin family protein [Bacteroidales bacterium]|jgi:predicted Zn-dependent peptidase|nr:pitrilysin family protein [Bacteroidales bacterium]